MSQTVYNIGTVNNNILNKWVGYKRVGTNLIKKEKAKWKTVSKKKTIRVSGFAGMQRAKINGVWKPGTVIALKDVFGADLPKAEYIMVNGVKIPIVRGDKRVELTRKIPNINRGDMIEVKAYHKELVEAKDSIPIEILDYEIYIFGDYDVGARVISAKGKKRVMVGVREPKGASADFWKNIFKEIKNEIMEDNNAPHGKWFNALCNIPEFRATGIGGLYGGSAAADLTATSKHPSHRRPGSKKVWIWGIDEDDGDYHDFEQLGNRTVEET